MPAKMTSSGVISEPPPIPVIPISTPTPRPTTMISGSIAGRLSLAVQAACRSVLSRPAAVASRAGLCARRAADRVIAPVVEWVVGQVVVGDESPHVAVGPVGQGVELPQAVRLVPLELGSVGARRGLLAAQAGDPGVEPAQGVLQRR